MEFILFSIYITHLEPYKEFPDEFGLYPMKKLTQQDFQDLPEYEVERILDEKFSRLQNGRCQQLFLTQFIGYEPEFDKWLMSK